MQTLMWPPSGPLPSRSRWLLPSRPPAARAPAPRPSPSARQTWWSVSLMEQANSLCFRKGTRLYTCCCARTARRSPLCPPPHPRLLPTGLPLVPQIEGLAGSKSELRLTWLRNDTTATSYRIAGELLGGAAAP